MGFSLYSRLWPKLDGLKRFSFWRAVTAPQLFVGSFLLLVGLGTVGFKTLPGLYTGEPLTWLDAFFTATSAVCVTGLIVVDTATYFTAWGQAYVLLLIQLGGLGILTFTTFIITALGLRLSLRHETIARSAAEVTPHIDYRRLTRHIVLFTFFMEAAGAFLLWMLWVPDLGWMGATWPALFHAISAFCNAGLSIFSDSLMSFQQDPLLLLVIMLLIVTGGIGFVVLEELYLWLRNSRQGHYFRLSLHSRIVLVTTVLLLVCGWVLFTLFEWSVTLDAMPAGSKLINGLFMSVTARTAGFNAIDYGQATNASNFLTILLMAIGGSPGSTAGGIKTTTFALIGIMAWTHMRGYDVASLWGRSIPEETMQRSIGLFVVVFGIITLGIFFYTTTEIAWAAYTEASFLPFMFEATSAFNTVGLSMGVTSSLSEVGRITTIVLMFVGRVGPLTFAAAFARQRAKTVRGFYYAYEDVGIG